MKLARTRTAKFSKRILVRMARPVTRRLRPGAVMMVHPGRCGSTVLGNMLNRHPQVRWDSELYTHATWGVGGSEQLIPSDPSRLLRRRMDYGLWRWFGFELKSHPLQNLVVMGWSEDRTVEDALQQGVTRFILLERKNLLRRMVSAMVAKSSGQYHRREGEAAKSRSLHLDPASVDFRGTTFALEALFDDWAACHEAWAQRLAPHAFLRLTYEDQIQQDPSVAYRLVCELLGIQPVEAAPDIRRTNPRPLDQIIDNWSEVASALEGTRHAWMLED